MAKKTKKAKTPKTDLRTEVRKFQATFMSLFGAHGVVIMFLIAGSVIGFSLIRARSYLNPERNEARYEELSSKNSYSKINYTLVTKLEASLNKAPIDIQQQLAPNRSNPFTE